MPGRWPPDARVAQLAEADIVCMAVPLTAETESLVGEREVAPMPPSAIFVNIARGKVVHIEALEMMSGPVPTCVRRRSSATTAP